MSLTAGDGAAALARERDLWEAYRSRDRFRLEALILPLALDVGLGGTLDRDTALEVVADLTIDAVEIADLSVRAFGDVEVVTYRASTSGTYRGRPLRAPDVVATTVWVRTDAGWRVAHRHESACGA